MPQLGLGLGLHKGSFLKKTDDPYAELKNLSTWLIDPSRPEGALGTATEFNAKPANPIQDQVGVVGSNLADPVRLYKGVFLAVADGKITIGGGTETSFIIPIEVGKQYTYSGVGAVRNRFAFFNSFPVNQQLPLSFGDNNTTTVAPIGAQFLVWYIGLTVAPTNNMINEGTTPLSFVPYGKANALITNVAWNTNDGYRVETAPNSKQVVGFKGDGTDTYGVVGGSPPNPLGTQDFGFARVIKPNALTGALFCRNTSATTDWQYGVLILGDGGGRLRVGAQNLTLPANTFTNGTFQKIIIKRKGSRLSLNVNGVEKYVNETFTTSLVEAPNVREFARSSNVGGTTHSDYFNGVLFHASYNNGVDLDKWETAFNKFCAKEYGL